MTSEERMDAYIRRDIDGDYYFVFVCRFGRTGKRRKTLRADRSYVGSSNAAAAAHSCAERFGFQIRWPAVVHEQRRKERKRSALRVAPSENARELQGR